MTATSRVDALLFDLDGTLVDTAPCIAAALNKALQDNALEQVDEGTIVTFIGSGVPVLIARALSELGIENDSATSEAILARYRAHYLQSCAPPLLPFPGVDPTLAELSATGLKLGVVTNTFDSFARTILARCHLAHHFGIVVSADTLPERKPHPAPLLYACRAFGVTPERTVFVGDSSNDAHAAAAASMRMVCMSYGYNEGRPLDALPCEAILERFTDLPAWLRTSSGANAR